MLGRLLFNDLRFVSKLECQSTVVRSFSVLSEQRLSSNSNNSDLFHCCRSIVRHKIRPVVYVNNRKCSTEQVEVISQPFYQGIAKVIADSDVVHFMQNGIIHLHDATGLPWWATFCLLPVVLKTCFLPFDVLKASVKLSLYFVIA